MGTNYYATITGTPCETCGHDPEARELHIGKSSAGWCFALHVEPNDPEHPHDRADWHAMLCRDDVTITNEYGDTLTYAQMCAIIEDRSRPERGAPYGYLSWDDFHRLNQSEWGPNNLIRARIGRYCIGHGAGTWDLHVGEFS